MLIGNVDPRVACKILLRQKAFCVQTDDENTI